MVITVNMDWNMQYVANSSDCILRDIYSVNWV